MEMNVPTYPAIRSDESEPITLIDLTRAVVVVVVVRGGGWRCFLTDGHKNERYVQCEVVGYWVGRHRRCPEEFEGNNM